MPESKETVSVLGTKESVHEDRNTEKGGEERGVNSKVLNQALILQNPRGQSKGFLFEVPSEATETFEAENQIIPFRY